MMQCEYLYSKHGDCINNISRNIMISVREAKCILCVMISKQCKEKSLG